MSRTKKFLYNSISTALMQLITLITGFIVPRVMLESYGSEINGLVSSISQFISYFNLVEAGLAGAAIFALYKPLANNDIKAINAVISAAKRFYMLSGYIFISLTLGLAVIYPIFIKTNELSSVLVCILVLILGISGALEFFTMAKYRVLLTADQKTYVISLISSSTIIINTLIIVVMAQFKVNIVILRATAVSSILIRSIMLAAYVKIRYKYINYKEKPNNDAMNKRWDALFLQVLGSIHTGTPIVLATIFTNLNIVSVYTIFNMVISGINGLLGIFNSGLPASFGELIVKEEKKTLQRSYREFEFSYYSLITVIYSVAMVTIMPFVRIYTRGITDVNYDIPILGFLFVLNGLLYNIKTPQGMLVISAGMYKETRCQTAIQGAIAIVLGVLFVPFLGLQGILIGYILANTYRDIDLLFFIPRNVTNLRVRDTFYRQIRIFAAMGIICIPFLFKQVNPQDYIQWFIFAAFVGVYATIVVLVLGLIFDKNELKNISKRCLSIIGKKVGPIDKNPKELQREKKLLGK